MRRRSPPRRGDSTGGVDLVKDRFVYTPYGERAVLTSAWAATSHAYAVVNSHHGGRLDPATGLVNFRFRDYDPATATWVEPDPLGYPDGASRYMSYRNRPTNLIDPLGLEAPDHMRQDVEMSPNTAEVLRRELRNIGLDFDEMFTSTLQRLADEYEKLSQADRGDVHLAPLQVNDTDASVCHDSPGYYVSEIAKAIQYNIVRCEILCNIVKLIAGGALVGKAYFTFDHKLMDAIFAAKEGGYAYKRAFDFQKYVTDHFGDYINDIGYTSDLAEAARHLMWMAILTRKFGEDNAKAIGDCHEVAPLGKPDGETDSPRDQANNRVGREIGSFPWPSDEEMYQRVLDAILSGKAFRENHIQPYNPLPFEMKPRR